MERRRLEDEAQKKIDEEAEAKRLAEEKERLDREAEEERQREIEYQAYLEELRAEQEAELLRQQEEEQQNNNYNYANYDGFGVQQEEPEKAEIQVKIGKIDDFFQESPEKETNILGTEDLDNGQVEDLNQAEEENQEENKVQVHKI